MNLITHTEFILYVADQQLSANFYTTLFDQQPDLNVPGMTEFKLGPTTTLGLMPNNGIAKILGNKMPHPETGDGIPRCELYFKTDQIQFFIQKAKELKVKMISELADRDWGDRVVYFADPDGHVIAFAETITT